MPLYEYQCKACGVRFDRQQSFKDDPIRVCPECEGDVYRVIGATGVIFKGSGFYINDSKKASSSTVSAGSKPSESGDSKPDAKSDAKADTKAETKTDAKADSTAAPAASSANAS
jgi:putative FmdB family regulatory protein